MVRNRLSEYGLPQELSGAARRFSQAGIGMDSELGAIDALLGEGLGNELVSQCASFRVRPASGCAT